MYLVVIPDYEGRASRDGFVAEVLDACHHDPRVHVAVVVNGGTENQRRGAAATNANHGRSCTTVTTSAGFNTAVLAGVRTAINLGADRVVRIDTAEHPLTQIMASFAMLDDADVVVRDLVFDERTLRSGTADEYHNLEVIPTLLSRFTGGALSLTGAHGFMGFRGELLAAVVTEVENLLARAEATRGTQLMWGIDTALAVVAERSGCRVNVEAIPATVLRDRSTAKCAQQLHDTLDLMLAL